ncbi:hypothetical protein ANCCAN_07457 [Ancylostoma caninum]|uniref:Uncharacterized protein n=1 Tax=Ancylostoma caninum TaxID=29170 RepID=A0A368GQ67_ANCCA|nr:hypothetical protein ANCCAN_07457 [Ancylostoma caninum]
MQIIPLLLICTTTAAVSSANECWRSGLKVDNVSYKGDQPYTKTHKLAVERIKEIYDKYSTEIGANPILALEDLTVRQRVLTLAKTLYSDHGVRKFLLSGEFDGE